MRTPSTSSEQTAAPATPSTFIAPKSQATPSEATPAAQPAWTIRFHKPSRVRAVRNPQPGNGVAHSGSHPPHLASSLQVPGIADDPDEAGGVRTVEDDASASFKGVEYTQKAFAVETADAEAFKPRSLPEAANAERHTSHLVAQESSRIGGINPDGPKPFAMPVDHSVTLPINQAPVSTAAHAMTYDMPYRKAVHIPFMATSGPTHSDFIKRVPFTFLDTPDPPSMYAEANSPVKGSANANGSTAEDWCTTSGHASFIDGGTLLQLSQWQKTAPSPTTECDHVAAAHSNIEASWPHSTTSPFPGDLMPPSTFISDTPAAAVSTHNHQYHPPDHAYRHASHLNPSSLQPADDIVADTPKNTPTSTKGRHFVTSLGLRAK
jgi:hypothetical protein